MKFNYVFLIICFFVLKLSALEKTFVIIIPSYNNVNWYIKNLESVLFQNYTNFRVVYIDDCSSDSTGELVEKFLETHDHTKKIKLVKNTKRMGALANYYHAILQCSPEEIIINLDGDDWFAHENVLSILNETYSNENIWLTYGQFIFYPSNKKGFCKEYPKEVIDINAFREYKFLASHLRTFYAGLFQCIKKEDLLFEGEFFSMAWDLAFMFPMLEMAGIEHIKSIDQLLYVYNRANVINDDKVNQKLQHSFSWDVIRKKVKYKKIQKFIY